MLIDCDYHSRFIYTARVLSFALFLFCLFFSVICSQVKCLSFCQVIFSQHLFVFSFNSIQFIHLRVIFGGIFPFLLLVEFAEVGLWFTISVHLKKLTTLHSYFSFQFITRCICLCFDIKWPLHSNPHRIRRPFNFNPAS